MARGMYERRGKNGDITYYIRYQVHHEDIKERVGRKSRGFTREMAKEALKSRLGDIAQGRFSLDRARKPIPFWKLTERYEEYGETNKRAWRFERRTLDMLTDFLGRNTPLSEISNWRLEAWKSERRKQVKPGTVNRQLNTIKHMFGMALGWGMMTENPAKGVKRFKVNDQRTRFLKEDEIARLLQACHDQETSPWLYPLVILALNTGMRQGELLSLSWQNVDLSRGVITVRQSKTLSLKTIEINEPARQALEWLSQHRYGDLVFMWPWREPIGRTTVHDAFKHACETAGITDFRFHDLRHTFASHLVMSGVDFATVKELLGHANITQTQRYAHLATAHKAMALTKLAERYAHAGEASAKDAQGVAMGSGLTAKLAQNRNVFNGTARAGVKNR